MSFSDFFRKAHPSKTVAIVQSNTVNTNIKLLYVAAAGDICLQLDADADAQPVAITVVANTWISLPIKRIWATNTTVANADMTGYT